MTEYHSQLNIGVFDRYMQLDQGTSVLAEYVWIGGNGAYRCKTKTLESELKSLEDYPIWNFDGSSTNQAAGDNSEVFIKPVRVFRDPFRGGKNVMVFCECVMPGDVKGNLEPHPSNTRRKAALYFEKVKAFEPWYGIEQEYTLFHDDGRTPFGWPRNGFPAPQGPFYCSAGTDVAFGRRVADAHYRACLYAGITVSGINAEVMAGQWEYQVGPCTGIDSGDELHMSRYIMSRVCEDFGVIVSFDPKPIPGDWNGAGCHTNYSTKAMRADGGYDVIIAALEALKTNHQEHIENYGVGNDRRLTGAHETAHIGQFTYGVANRGASARIPIQTSIDKKGYLEDRRPASNMDPYVVTFLVAKTTISPLLPKQ